MTWDTQVASDRDANGVVVFGVATPGPRDDGAYYQALVEAGVLPVEDHLEAIGHLLIDLAIHHMINRCRRASAEGNAEITE